MPIYDFRCKKCRHKFTVLTGISERDRVECPQCRSKEVEQLISACSVRSGSGCSGPGGSGNTGFKGG
ncbi:MAG: FmdB family zinc ribbon protein [Bacillota bacterium]